jgi:hypothetical protein
VRGELASHPETGLSWGSVDVHRAAVANPDGQSTVDWCDGSVTCTPCAP